MFSKLKEQFNLNRRPAEYGPYFIKREGDHGDVGYPPGFDIRTPETNLNNALNAIEQIYNNLQTIIASNPNNDDTTVCKLVDSTIKVLIFEINELKAMITNKTIKADEVSQFTINLATNTSNCVNTAERFPPSSTTQAGMRALADALQITRRSIPDTLLVHDFKNAKSQIEVARNNLVKQSIIPHNSSEMANEAIQIIEEVSSATRPSTPQNFHT